MSLYMITDDLPVIGAQLQALHANLSQVLGTSLAPAMPIPAGGDCVSKMVAEYFCDHTVDYFGETVPGITHLLAGAEMLYPISADTGLCDASNGADITVARIA
ncbi:hypothetical protein [Nocardia jejuensis]|uniref:hypothetical protein n=1 Tax=Nocardia jejuensis TaxID=328049 RepID=UPI00083292A2|nr:hypothetical protein [Nocardia jejuensis]